MRRAFILAAALAAILAGAAHAEHIRSTTEKASRLAYIRDSSVGTGASAEAVDLTTLAEFTENHRSFSVVFENEDSTDDLLVQVIESGSVTASELTTPPNATLSRVVRIPAGRIVSVDVQGVGWVWQSETNAVAANATVSD